MKRALPAIVLLIVVGGGWWYNRGNEARAVRVWKPLAGGGEARVLTVTHGTTHTYREPPPGFGQRLNEAIRKRSMAPLRKPQISGISGSTSTGRPGLGVWLELRGAPPSSLPKEAELILPSGHTFYANGASGGGSPGGWYRTTSIFEYIPYRAKTLRYACKFGGQRIEFDFDNPVYRTDLPVWKAATLPQMQQSGPISLTLRAVKLERAPNYRNRPTPEWHAHPAWTISKDGENADKWFSIGATYGDPTGQSLRNCGMLEEPVWKVQCSLSRTNDYPFRDDEVQWVGTVFPGTPDEQTTQLFTIDPKPPSDNLKLAGIFGAGEYTYADGAIVKTDAPKSRDPKGYPEFHEDYRAKTVNISLKKPSVVLIGSAFLIYRDEVGHATRFTSGYSQYGSVAGHIETFELPKAPIRIGVVSSVEPGTSQFEFLIAAPEKPGLKKPVAAR